MWQAWLLPQAHPPTDGELIRALAATLSDATGHTFRGSDSRTLRDLAKHDRKMLDGGCSICTLLDMAVVHGEQELARMDQAWHEQHGESA